MSNLTLAEIYKQFLEFADTREEWDDLLELALTQCLNVGNSMHADLWLSFNDGSECDVKCNVKGVQNE